MANNGTKSRSHKAATPRLISHGLALTIGGLALGWIIGLSISPVIQGVIAALLSAAVGVVGVIAGIEGWNDDADAGGDEKDKAESLPKNLTRRRSRKLDVTPWPIACLTVALAIGATIGAMARAGEWLSPDPVRLSARWEKTGLGEAELMRRLFEHTYSPPEPAGEENKDKLSFGEHRSSVLLFNAAVRKDLCEGLAGIEDAKSIENYLKADQDPNIRELVARCKGDTECLKALKTILCPTKSP